MNSIDRFIYNHVLSDIGRVIWDSFEKHPEEWESDVGERTVDNHNKEISLWISNGSFFFDGFKYYPKEYQPNGRKYINQKVDIGLIERHFLYHKLKKCVLIGVPKRNLEIIKRFNEDEI